ncbi:uncharacterized protein LOC100742517 isoform X1 [Bombus impatiens]|uniref:Uncharacterized protein LOC100742517 isoform X1 n=2 Tax=Bombus impatiens TaxID=132113 RepID=A0A6P8LQQ8_BOMIM|nr:uncharacterized protein LOC100742517 isoform X1 [Bombus impatiens]
MEAPDDRILVGPIPSQLNITGEINSTYSNGSPELGAVILRAEEALIVIFVLFLWAAAIALFFNRWGKIRMLEPSQPKFLPQDEQNCTTIEQNQLQRCLTRMQLSYIIFHQIENRRTFSKCNILCEECPIKHDSNYALGQMRPRQNSAFIGSSVSFLPGGGGTARRTKSAFDLQFSVFTENNTLDSFSEQDTLKNFKPACDSTKLLLDERKTSVYQLDKTGTTKSFCRNRGISVCQFDTSPKLWQRDRGMSICQFDRMEVLARPLQRDRGGSICQFDRMDVLARSLQRDRIGSAYHFDRMDVLARPNVTLDKFLLREKRVSMCNLLGKNEKTTEGIQMERHLSNGNVGKIGEKDTSGEEERGRIMAEEQKTFIKQIPKEKKNSFCRSNQPSCSQTSDTAFGYKGTCV